MGRWGHCHPLQAVRCYAESMIPTPPPEPPLKRLSQYFFRGLITFLPLAITVYVLVLFVTWTERTAMQLLRPFTGVPDA